MVVVVTRRISNTLPMAMGSLHHNKDIRTLRFILYDLCATVRLTLCCSPQQNYGGYPGQGQQHYHHTPPPAHGGYGGYGTPSPQPYNNGGYDVGHILAVAILELRVNM